MSNVEVAVEKLDLRNLFEPVCAEFRVPITNFKGWSDLNSRAAIMRRFKQHEAEGRRGVLLLWATTIQAVCISPVPCAKIWRT
jgi:hypothetical protein